MARKARQVCDPMAAVGSHKVTQEIPADIKLLDGVGVVVIQFNFLLHRHPPPHSAYIDKIPSRRQLLPTPQFTSE